MVPPLFLFRFQPRPCELPFFLHVLESAIVSRWHSSALALGPFRPNPCVLPSSPLQAIVDMTRRCWAVCQDMARVESTNKPMAPQQTRVDLITALRAITEGRMYVEVERARLTRALATVLESDGKLDEASTTLQEVAVETFGSMDPREKTDTILEQVRLTHRQRDYVRMGIIANKISDKVIRRSDMSDLQLRYRDLNLRLHRHRKQTLLMAEDYLAIYNVPEVRQDPTRWRESLSRAAIAVALSPFDEEAQVMMHSMLRDGRMKRLSRYHSHGP